MDIQATLEAIAAEAARGEMIFPTHVQIDLQVQHLLDDPDCSIDRLCKLISAEPVLSARVVGVANSIAYNPSGRTSSDLRGAVARIGFKTLRTLASAVVVRQMQEMPKSAEHRAMAARLWEHTAQVATLARVIARKVTHQDPEAAFFAGIVHEIGGFYLISRAASFPGLLSGDLEPWHGLGEAQVGRAVLNALSVPADILAALDAMWDGYLAMPPQSLGDTLLLADELASTESPLDALSGMSRNGLSADIDLVIGDDMLQGILADSAEEMASLISALSK
jgi:HD-like signal output (HDOD) protein